MSKKILSHLLDSDSDCSDSEQDNSYADVIEKKLNTLEPISISENRVARGVSIIDFILSFVAHKVLSCPPVRLAYTKIKSPLEFIKNAKSHNANIDNINKLITQQHEINNDLHDSFLFMPVVSNTLRHKYDEFQKSGHKLTFHDDLKLDGSIENIVHKVKILVSTNLATKSNVDFVRNLMPFIEYLTNGSDVESYNKLLNYSHPTFHTSVLKCLKKCFIKDRVYNFSQDITRIKNNKEYLKQQSNLDKECRKLLECASSKYKIHKEKIYKVELESVQYQYHYDYGQAVKNADFLPQVLCYARTIKNFIKNKILSHNNYSIDMALPHVTEDVPVIVTIYNTLATNLLVYNIGSYKDIAKENIFDTYIKYFLHRTPPEIVVKKEAALYVLMQMEVIRNPSALLTNVMFLLLVKEEFKSLRRVEEEDSQYCWANIKKQLPMAMEQAVIESLNIEYQLFSHGLISGKRLFDYRQILESWDSGDMRLSYRNSDILFDWLCYKINAKQILGRLNEGLNDQTILMVDGIQYNVIHENDKIILTNQEYTLYFKLSYQRYTYGIKTRSMTSAKQNANKDGNSTPTNENAYCLESINKFPLNVFDEIIKQYIVDEQEIKLDKLHGCVNISVKPRDIQDYPTPNKNDNTKNYRDSRECEAENSDQECSVNKIPRLDSSPNSVNDDVEMIGEID